MVSKDEIKDRVLTENTAQGILNHLRDLESNRARMQRRWIWELLQNARDASADGDTELIASVDLRNGELLFRHNGRGFRLEEVAHLIYHGSTKLEDENTIGQYGSGFLTTHLLSPEIGVSGQLSDGRPFSFDLKREVTSASALSDSMDRAWNEFDTYSEDVPDSFTTQFRYPISEDSSRAVEEGIETLRRCAPFVVAFNRQFRKITIESPEETIDFTVIERERVSDEGLEIITVGVGDGENLNERKFLLGEGTQTSVVVPIASAGDQISCIPLEELPRLFLGFPLVGTESFSFPSVVNSFQFTPTENRDGVYLGQSEDEVNRVNQAVLVEACDLHLKLLAFAAESGWANVHLLADVPPIIGQNWLNKDWLQEQLEQLVDDMRETPAVLVKEGPLASHYSILPLASSDTGVETLWDLMHEVEDLRRKLPSRHEAVGWRDSIVSWASLMGRDPTLFDEGMDGNKLVAFVEEEAIDPDEGYGTLENLQGLLVDEAEGVQWLNQLYAFLKGDGLPGLIRERRFILDQLGCLDELDNLYRDDDVDENLKDIGDDFLKRQIRGKLRDNRMTSLADESGKGDYSNEDAIREIVDKLRELCTAETLTDGYAQASTRMLAWLAGKRRWSDIISFPAFSVRPEGTRVPLWIGLQGGDDVDIPLAPISAWPESLRVFADLFPWSYTLAEMYYSELPAEEVWEKLREQGYIRMDVLESTDRHLISSRGQGEFLPNEPLPDGDHRTINTVTVNDLAFLARDRIGIMARVRDSQERARLFWRFLTEYLVHRDIESLELSTVACACGEEHDYYPAYWLVPLVRNRWVPQGNDIRDHATAHSLAKLLQDSGWTPTSLSETSPIVSLLAALKITRLDLIREFVVSDDESRANLDDAMTSILISTGGDLSHVSDFVEDLMTDEDLPAHLAERRQRRKVVHENQWLGQEVERLVKEGLENEGFTVRRTGIGSDFEIEYDVTEDGQEIGIELSRNGKTWLVEVKATREMRVRMSAKQGETAATKGEGFLLCVVPVGDDIAALEEDAIRADMRFVQNIGPRVDPLCQELNALNDLRDDAISATDRDIHLEIQGGAARIRVDNTVWQEGFHLQDLPNRLLQSDSTTSK